MGRGRKARYNIDCAPEHPKSRRLSGPGRMSRRERRFPGGPNKQRTPDAAKAVIGQFPASVMTLALLAGYPDTRKRRSDAAKIVFLPS